ncbi:hypothetical protein DL95DRAFT_396917, partial [Leptodontidium sp. 2 PMI_412]
HDLLTEKIAIDCEMMRSNIGQVLGRVSVINYEGVIIFDTFVCYPEPITAYLVELLRNRIVIGHDIQKDLTVISMDLPSHIARLYDLFRLPTQVTFDIKIRDTQRCRKYLQFANAGAYQGPSLKNLALKVLGRPIK